MTTNFSSIIRPEITAAMSDAELLAATARAASSERHATAGLVALLAELEQRRLYLGEGCASLFTYCTQKLHLSEQAAYLRIEAARAAKRFPAILDLLADGSVTVTTVAMLRRHLTHANHHALLAQARHKSKRQVEHQIAELAPRPDARSLIRRLPSATTTGLGDLAAPRPPDDRLGVRDLFHPAQTSGVNQSAPMATPRTPTPGSVRNVARPFIGSLSRDRFLLRVTLSAEAHDRFRRAQGLLRHTVPDGDPAVIIDKALTVLIQTLERTKFARVQRPHESPHMDARAGGPGARTLRLSSRHIPASVRRKVWERDNARCAFVGSLGRCSEITMLEFHHLIPFARGGPSTVENIALRCRAHNGYQSELDFGFRWG